ncbi:MAG: tocopherol cyclase family protein [Eubacteriales bacterium]|nr:tocopherol cyclase family protein [Eubacteriales bacterium]
MSDNRFQGWYFKHRAGENIISFIPGYAENRYFIQVITENFSRVYNIKRLYFSDGINADKCRFGKRGVYIDLPGIYGKLRYGKFTRLDTDIMGPFRFLPMECRHGVISMNHGVDGSLCIDGKMINFNGGHGYIETDGGSSFPGKYLWLQCNSFPVDCSVMAAVADIPVLFALTHFMGCICAVIFKGKEYRIATYKGARIISSADNHIILKQGKLLFEADIIKNNSVFGLSAPVRGKMSRIIRESNNAAVRLRLWNDDKPIFDLTSDYASFEYNF